MRIRQKTKSFLKSKKSDSNVQIDNIEIKADIINFEKSKINIYFKGQNSSGILTISEKEAESIINSLKPFISKKR